MTTAKYHIHPVLGSAELDASEHRRIEGEELGIGFEVRTTGGGLAGLGWAIRVALTDSTRGAYERLVYDDDIAVGMARGEALARELIRERGWGGR